MMSKQSALSSWNSKACRRLSAHGRSIVPHGLHFDHYQGVFTSSPGEARTSSGIPHRRWTWEDTLQPTHIHLRKSRSGLVFNASLRRYQLAREPSDLDKLSEIRSSHRCRRVWHCDAIGLPPAIATWTRPVKAFVAQSTSQGKVYFALPIEKAGLSTLDAFFSKVERNPHMKVSSWVSQTKRPACRNATGLQVFAQIEALVREPGKDMNALDRACGLASSFGVNDRMRRISFSVVRDPVARFLSGYSDHGGSVQRSKMGFSGLIVQSERELVKELAGHAAELASGRLTMALVPPYATIHSLTQSYFLSGTDARGQPLDWDLIARLENIDGELSDLAAKLLSGSKKGVSTAFRFPHRNAKRSSASRASLLRAIRRHPALMCDLCRVYGQDFVCLGYPVPSLCLKPACLSTLRAELQTAFRQSIPRSPGPGNGTVETV